MTIHPRSTTPGVARLDTQLEPISKDHHDIIAIVSIHSIWDD